MTDALIINSTASEVRLAVLHNEVPVELYVERRQQQSVVGNIYRGRVVRVLPGLQAAFVDIGLSRTAFLYVNDALPQAEPPLATALSLGSEYAEVVTPPPRQIPLANIADVLRKGQEIVVQVQKAPLGSKGARLTTHLTLVGRFLVLLPESSHLGISQRLVDAPSRRHLHALLQQIVPPHCGLVARTAALGMEQAVLQREATLLQRSWQLVQAANVAAQAQRQTPQLLHAELDLVRRATRELYDEQLSRIVVDNPDDFKQLQAFVRAMHPDAAAEHAARVQLYRGAKPIFDHFRIETALQRALQRRVALPSGGSLVLDQAEALTVIDVNSASNVGKHNLEATLTQINLEAAQEVAKQLRLRNIGGIVVIDFIDMSHAVNRQKVLAQLQTHLQNDRAKTQLMGMSELGLVELTRKRVRQSLGQVLCEPCSYCEARSVIKTVPTVAHELLRQLCRSLASKAAGPPQRFILLNSAPEVAAYLESTASLELQALEKRLARQIVPVACAGYHREHYDINAGTTPPSPKPRPKNRPASAA